MTERDWRIFKDTAKEVLDNKKDKTTTPWRNPKSGASGKFSVLETLEREGAHCRKMGIFNSAGGVTSKSVFVFCKQPDGDWKVAP